MIATPPFNVEHSVSTTPVRRVSKATAVASLRQTLTQFERRYEMSSQQMLEAVRTGERRETAEIAEWFVMYRALQRLLGLRVSQ